MLVHAHLNHDIYEYARVMMKDEGKGPETHKRWLDAAIKESHHIFSLLMFNGNYVLTVADWTKDKILFHYIQVHNLNPRVRV